MPRKNIYIRNEDLDKWDAIESKPEWLHTHLQVEVGIDVVDTDLGEIAYPVVTKPTKTPREKTIYPFDEVNAIPVIKTPEDAERAIKPISANNPIMKFCKNGHVANEFGKCLQKGCKYS